MFTFTVYSSKIDLSFRVVAGSHAPMAQPDNWRTSVYEAPTADQAVMAAYSAETIERIREQIFRFVPESFLDTPAKLSERSKKFIATRLANVATKKSAAVLPSAAADSGAAADNGGAHFTGCRDCLATLPGPYGTVGVSLCRYDGKSLLCSSCGTTQAINPQYPWPIVAIPVAKKKAKRKAGPGRPRREKTPCPTCQMPTHGMYCSQVCAAKGRA